MYIKGGDLLWYAGNYLIRLIAEIEYIASPRQASPNNERC